MEALVRKRSNWFNGAAATPLQKLSLFNSRALRRAFAHHLGFRFFQRFPLHGAKPDIAPAEPIRPTNPIDRPIRPRLRLAHGLAQRADIEHAAAIGEDTTAVRLGAGVE